MTGLTVGRTSERKTVALLSVCRSPIEGVGIDLMPVPISPHYWRTD